MVREAARLAGLTWTDEEAREVTESLSSLARSVEKREDRRGLFIGSAGKMAPTS